MGRLSSPRDEQSSEHEACVAGVGNDQQNRPGYSEPGLRSSLMVAFTSYIRGHGGPAGGQLVESGVGGVLCSSTNRAPSMGAGDKRRSSDYVSKHLKVIFQPNRLLSTIHLVLLP